MKQELTKEDFIKLGLDESDVSYLMKLTDRKSIVNKENFLKITSLKTKDEDRDEYSLLHLSSGKCNDIYHDKNFKEELTRIFLRSIVGMNNFIILNDGHSKAISYNFFRDEELKLKYKDLMRKFWADKILSASIIKYIAVRLRFKKNTNLRNEIHDNLVLVNFANEKVLNSFFYGDTSDVSFSVEDQPIETIEEGYVKPLK